VTKEIVNEARLLESIQERINNSDELDGDCRGVIANAVYWHEKDESGCNWDVHSFRNVGGCEDVMIKIINEFKLNYNLEEN
jgi:hypothetical protein